jgi:Fe2+ transport system protein B
MDESSRDPTRAAKYNFIYAKLVEDENDILGIIAYSMYKRQKIEYIQTIDKKYGREPTNEEFQSFYAISNSDSQLENYQSQAIALANQFLEEALAEKAQELEDYFSEKTRQEIRSIRPSFMSGVFQSLIGSVIFVLFLGLLVFFTWSLKQGPVQLIEAIFDVKITKQSHLHKKNDPDSPTQQSNTSNPHLE